MICTRCHAEKPIESGRRRCAACLEYRRAWYRKHKRAENKSARAWNLRHSDKTREAVEKWRAVHHEDELAARRDAYQRTRRL